MLATAWAVGHGWTITEEAETVLAGEAEVRVATRSLVRPSSARAAAAAETRGE
jgi:hypothetical protein